MHAEKAFSREERHPIKKGTEKKTCGHNGAARLALFQRLYRINSVRSHIKEEDRPGI